MLESAFLGHDRVPRDPLTFGFDRIAIEVSHTYRIFFDHRDLAVAEKKNVTCVLQDWRYIRGDKVFTISEADNDGRTFSNSNNCVRLVGRNYRERKNSA